MAQDIERVRRIKAAAEDDLLSRPGVTAVDVGYKFVNGRKTDEIVIRIHVAEKKMSRLINNFRPRYRA